MIANMIQSIPVVPSNIEAEAADDLLMRSSDVIWASRAPIFRRGGAMLARRERMLVPICLNNGYYTRERIRLLLEFAVRASSHVSVFFTDGPAVHNYVACGETPAGARQECRRHANRLRNHCAAAMDSLNAGKQECEHVQIELLEWDGIYKSEVYRGCYEYLLTLYRSNDVFRRDTSDATRQVLEKKLDTERLQRLKHIDRTHALETAVHYSIEELAFLMAFQTDMSLSQAARPTFGPYLYVYYQRWPVFEMLVDGCYDQVERANIGFHLFGTNLTELRPAGTE